MVACPRGNNRFIVGGGSELRLYEWEVSFSWTQGVSYSAVG